MIKIIAAISENNVLGNDNKLLWSLPNDLKRFKEITNSNYIVMGRKTHESIGKYLPGRKNIIITRELNYKSDNCIIVHSIEKALEICNKNCFIIGGGEIYKKTINICDFMFITKVHVKIKGDTYFPIIGEEWKPVFIKENKKDKNHNYNYTFINYERIKS